MRTLTIRSSIAALCLASATLAHEQNVHCRLTREAVTQSARFCEVVKELEFDQHAYSPWYQAGAMIATPSIGVLSRDAASLVMAGSVLEDGLNFNTANSIGCSVGCPPSVRNFNSSTRVIHHFQDPTGKAILPISYTAQQWGWKGSSNEFTWLDALEEYENSILDPDPATRLESEERMLVALGCNLHLLQDQTSPSHTRHDQHVGFHKISIGLMTGGSLLEERGPQYISMAWSAIPLGTGSPVVQPTHADYFSDQVNWTSSNFFSDDTIDQDYTVPSAWTLSVPNTCPPVLLFFQEQYFRSTDAQFHGIHTRLARRRAAPLWNAPAVVPTRDTLVGSSCDTRRSDAVIFDNLSLLAPRAVSSSAGLIDHFFRGRLALEQDPAGNLVITNDSYMAGAPDVTFTQDPAATGSMEIAVMVEMPDGSRVAVKNEAIPPLAHKQKHTIFGLGAALPSGATPRVWACLRNAQIGSDPGVAAGRLDWVTCSSICLSDGFEVTPVPEATAEGNDGFTLFVPFDSTVSTPGAGSLALYSPIAGCGERWRRTGWNQLQLYGARVAGVGDITGDDVGELLVQNGYDSSTMIFQMSVVNGATGLDLFSYDLSIMGDLLTLGDIDKDGVLDLGVDATATFNGYFVLSGGKGTFIGTLGSVQYGDRVSRAPDWDGDGVYELLVEKPGGTLLVLDPANGAVHYGVAYAGFNDFAVLEDVNGDGVHDIAGKLPDPDPSKPATVAVFSGKQMGQYLLYLADEAHQIAPAGDFNGSPGGELVTRKLVDDGSGNGTKEWQIRVWDVAAASVLTVLTESDLFASIPTDFGDMNGDGRSDLAYSRVQSGVPGSCVHLIFGSSATP
jgi:hypothetical protein